MKNKWLAAGLNIIPGLGYLYAGVRTPFALLLLLSLVLLFVSGATTSMEDIQAMEEVPISIWDILSLVAVVAAFASDAYIEVTKANTK